jgi:multicomponent Na+:H+ antiporter subunit D
VREHLPALLVVIPLLAAPVCFLLRRAALVRAFTVAITWLCLGMAVALLQQVRSAGTVVYQFGNWPRPLGIEYIVDHANALVLLIVAFIAAVVLPIGPGQGRNNIPPGRDYVFYSAFLLCFTGLLGVTITGDAFNIFVFLEISSLSTYILVALGEGRRALKAAFSYLIVGTIGATFLLIGIGLIYQMTGTLNLPDLAARLPQVHNTRTILVAFAFITVGISIKLAVFPLHQWLPNAYANAPSVVSAFLASTATKVAYYLLLRFIFTVFGAGFVFTHLKMQLILLPLSLLAMFTGSIAAIYQTDFKRLLAYSSIAQIGYMTLGLSFNSVTGLTAGLVHLFNHAMIKGGLFLVAACVVHRIGSSRIADMRGLGRRMPLTAAALVVGGLALVGVPATAGFVSKWYLISAALEKGYLAVAGLILLSSLLALVYVWKVVEVMYFREPPEGATPHEAPALFLVPTWVLIGASVYFGLDADFSSGLAAAAARQLLGVES